MSTPSPSRRAARRTDLPKKGVAAASGRKKPPVAKASHDVEPPAALIAFMIRGWEKPPRGGPEPIEHAAELRARRRALSRRFPGEVLVIPTGHEKVRANDTHHRFRAGTDFFYLTGNHEPDCVLVLEPTKTGHRDVLYVEPNPGKSDKTFFTDRVKGELWVGPRLGVPESKRRFGVHEARSLRALADDLAKHRRFRLLRGLSDALDGRRTAGQRPEDKALAEHLSEARLEKSPSEIVELREAIASTRRGFDDVIRSMKTAKSEREIEGVFNLRARVEGNDVGYGTIAAAGHHACTLHWTRNDGRIKKGDLLLLDAGVEGRGLYTADVTRTLPISGKFSKAQREVYELVLEAQLAAMAEIRPGQDFLAPHRAAMRVLAKGLERLGVLEDAEDALAEEKQLYKRYTLHNVSHMLGLDVHDCARARQETYKYGKLTAGMVLTNEPGLYFQTDDLTVPERLRGIGVRIEDDVLVTPDGHDVLSADIPKAAREVEAWISDVWRARSTGA